MEWMAIASLAASLLLTAPAEEASHQTPRSAVAANAAAEREFRSDGRRQLQVERYGLRLRHPQAWRLSTWGAGDKAFVLRLPQQREPGQAPNEQVGLVSCTLALAPKPLETQQREQQALAQRAAAVTPPQRKLVSNTLQKIGIGSTASQETTDAAPRRRVTETDALVAVWRQYATETKPGWLETHVRLIAADTLFTFTLTSDEAHYDAYEADFFDMLATVHFTEPQVGLRRLPNRHWQQRELRFVLQLPEGWRPAFGPNDAALFFAQPDGAGPTEANLTVVADQNAAQNLERVKAELAATLQSLAPDGDKPLCRIVPQTQGDAVEAVMRVRRNDRDETLLLRRFHLQGRNYEVRFTVPTALFAAEEEPLRAALDSFLATPEPGEEPLL